MRRRAELTSDDKIRRAMIAIIQHPELLSENESEVTSGSEATRKTSKKPKPAVRSMPCSAHLWRVTVNDAYTTQTYEIAGTDTASIRDVMNAAKRRLKGKLVREWNGEGGDAPNPKLSDAL